MSLGVIINGPEGVVLAAESRVTMEVRRPDSPSLAISFDNATKLLAFSPPNNYVGAVTFGLATIGQRTAHSYIPELESTLPGARLSVRDFAQHLSDFYVARFNEWSATLPAPYEGPDMCFVVGGYDELAPYGRILQFNVPSTPVPSQPHPDNQFGMVWGGQREIVDRLLTGYDPGVIPIAASLFTLDAQKQAQLRQALEQRQLPIPLNALALQDCVDLAIFLVRTTIEAQRLTVGIRGCGGRIDVATVTRNQGLTFVQRKQIIGER